MSIQNLLAVCLLADVILSDEHMNVVREGASGGEFDNHLLTAATVTAANGQINGETSRITWKFYRVIGI